ncbi:tRNA uridine-5-carboxymethylaminomethyl(34) synthesis GTPase MnmE [Alkalibaculum sp. M08DMB]|uniref:tRNA modification GTPase MnmE n=1 Tax=Alkalibaculum sporogenes TaxID=2655001 RepID=A0A6A7K7I7_9FIRM|nr:tRNA uridine-5-carboxymethylaminomethyl(34) synthesis GTPase MnmE [Alkalibaculum sporogenes]MPW25311.1 tRNA uridine-5-carboxymethylaminomethyl(34) synthesis GTPase MnmE [Alkalibaculum sporogenes]
MSAYLEDTIAAISTPVGFAGIGIVRMTGLKSFYIIDKIFKSKAKAFESYEDKKIIYGHIINPKDGIVIDEVLVSKMISPNTYTREDVVEINCHGGIIPVKNILNLLVDCGARLAEPGEFTKRAFLNGRIDLAQAEAVIDIINSKTNKSLNISMKQLGGSISRTISEIRDSILEMLAHIEASIDYPEYDIEDVSYDLILDKTKSTVEKVEQLIYNAENGRLIREGVNTAIIGKPNVGKSSLLNALIGESRAIVTEIAGTTRDTIEEYINIEGIPLKIIDTAGIRETENIIEKMGIEKTVQILEQSDLVLLMLDGSLELEEQDIALLELVKDKKAIIVVNKADKDSIVSVDNIAKTYDKEVVEISATQELGIDILKKTILDLISAKGFEIESFEIISNIRHINLLQQSLICLKSVINTIDISMPLEIISIDLKEAWNLLGEITGDTIHENLIDQIFKNFCIGK